MSRLGVSPNACSDPCENGSHNNKATPGRVFPSASTVGANQGPNRLIGVD